MTDPRDLSLPDQIRLARVNSLLAWSMAYSAESAEDGMGLPRRDFDQHFKESADGTVYVTYFEDGDNRTVELPEELVREYVELKTLLDSIDEFADRMRKIDRAWTTIHAEREALLQHLRTKSKTEALKDLTPGRYVSKSASYNALAPVYVKTHMQWLRNGRDHVDVENLPDDLVPLTVA